LSAQLAPQDMSIFVAPAHIRKIQVRSLSTIRCRYSALNINVGVEVGMSNGNGATGNVHSKSSSSDLEHIGALSTARYTKTWSLNVNVRTGVAVLNGNDATGSVKAGTFVIYSPHDNSAEYVFSWIQNSSRFTFAVSEHRSSLLPQTT
jgi:hypothetical protein